MIRSVVRITAAEMPKNMIEVEATIVHRPGKRSRPIRSAKPANAADHAAADDDCDRKAPHQRRSGQRAERRRHRSRQHPQPGLERRHAEHELKILRDEQEVAGESEQQEGVRRQRHVEGGNFEQPQIDQGMRELLLAPHEDISDDDAGNDARKRQPSRAALRRALDAPDHREHGGSDSAALRRSNAPLDGARYSGNSFGPTMSRSSITGRRAGTPRPTRNIQAAARRRSGR